MAYLYHLAAVVALLSFVCYGEALRCWTCSSDLDPHCADPFNYSSPTFNLHHTLTDCDTQTNPSLFTQRTKSVCKKMVRTEYNRQVVVRACEWLKNRNEEVGPCSENTYSTPSYTKVDFCATCDYDGCNSAQGLYSNAMIWKALIPAMLALFLCF